MRTRIAKAIEMIDPRLKRRAELLVGYLSTNQLDVLEAMLGITRADGIIEGLREGYAIAIFDPNLQGSDPEPYPSDTGTCVHCGLPMLRKDPAFPNRTRLCNVRRSIGGVSLECQPFHEASE